MRGGTRHQKGASVTHPPNGGGGGGREQHDSRVATRSIQGGQGAFGSHRGSTRRLQENGTKAEFLPLDHPLLDRPPTCLRRCLSAVSFHLTSSSFVLLFRSDPLWPWAGLCEGHGPGRSPEMARVDPGVGLPLAAPTWIVN